MKKIKYNADNVNAFINDVEFRIDNNNDVIPSGFGIDIPNGEGFQESTLVVLKDLLPTLKLSAKLLNCIERVYDGTQSEASFKSEIEKLTGKAYIMKDVSDGDTDQ